ncbi:MAG: DUF1801 domain-containing protein [Actinomycetes bacterium]
MAEPKTRPTGADVDAFLSEVPDDTRRNDATALSELMQRITGEKPVMWGPAIVGFGSRQLKYASGRELDWPRVAFSPRKANLTLYLTFDFAEFADQLARLGKHTNGKGCLYIKRLADVDQTVLAELIKDAFEATTAR